MGKSASKFYQARRNEDFTALFLGKHGLDVIYGDEGVREAVARAAERNWSSFERDDVSESRTQLVGKISKTDFEVRMMIQQQIVKDFIHELSEAGWKPVCFCNLQEGNVFGHSWIFKRGGVEEKFQNVFNINPAEGNDLFVSCTDPTKVDDIERAIRSMSTEKGIKSMDPIEGFHGVKLCLRHKPWDLDEFDWWGGAFLLSKLFEKLAPHEIPMITQGSPGIDLSKRAKVCFVAPAGRDALRFRRTSKRVTDDFVQGIRDVWPDGIEEDVEQEKMGFKVKFNGDALRSPEVILHLFDCMHKHGNKFFTGIRMSSIGKGRSAMAFVTGRDPPRGELACIYLHDGDTMSFARISGSTEDKLKAAGETGWYKGVKRVEDHSIVFKGNPWSEEVYAEMLMCDMISIMDEEGYEVITAIATGEGGDMFVFNRK